MTDDMQIYNKAWLKDTLEICNGICFFEIEGVKIFFSCREVDFPASTHTHDDLEFMCVKRQSICHLLYNRVETTLPSGYVLPILPMIPHGESQAERIKQFICIMYPAYHLKELNRQAGCGNIIWKSVPFPLSAEADYIIGMIFNEHLRGTSCNNMVLKCLLKILYIEFARSADLIKSEDKIEYRLKRAVAFMEEQTSLMFSLNNAAAAAGMSKYYFLRKFKELFGITPKKYFLTKKIDRAKVMLCQTKSVTETAFSLGFSSSAYFSQVFKIETGISPREFMNRTLP